MGITGLLPFLKKAHKLVNIKQFEGCTVAIDTYCWLHKGAFACVEKLANNDKTDQYVRYCMKYVNQLLSFGIKPILVFDGCHLPSKKLVELSRRERRTQYRKKAAQLLREGKKAEARQCLERAIDVTPEMALEVMKAARQAGVDCIVAPYEADSQLAYLNKVGIAQIIITEDSDLLLFGCEKVFFKMDISGNGILIEKADLSKAAQIKESAYTFDSFRYMCILSGCDYLPSLPGIGLGKASKVFGITRHPDIRLVLKKLPLYLKNSSMKVPQEYIDGFVRAVNTFLYQLVFDPIKRKLVPLNDYPDDIDTTELTYAGPPMSHHKALQIALGNINVNSGVVMDTFDPETFKPLPVKSKSWDTIRKKTPPTAAHMQSMWSRDYRPRSADYVPPDDKTQRKSTVGMEIVVNSAKFRKKSPRKRKHSDNYSEEEGPTDGDLTSYYNQTTASHIPTEAGNDLDQMEPSSADNFHSLSPPHKKTQRLDSDSEGDGEISHNFGKFSKRKKLDSECADENVGRSSHKDRRKIKTPKLLHVFEMTDNIVTKADGGVNSDSDGGDDGGDKEPKNASFTEGEGLQNDDTPKPWLPPRNIFAVNAERKSKFNLDAKKVKVEVKSRFFSKMSPPTKQVKVTEILNSFSSNDTNTESQFDNSRTSDKNSKTTKNASSRRIGLGAFAWKAKTESVSSVEPNFDFKPVRPKTTKQKSPQNGMSILSSFKRVAFNKVDDKKEINEGDLKNSICVGVSNQSSFSENNEDNDASKANVSGNCFEVISEASSPSISQDASQNLSSELDMPESQKSIGTYSFSMSQPTDMSSSQTSWKISSSQQDALIKNLEADDDVETKATLQMTDSKLSFGSEISLSQQRPSSSLSISPGSTLTADTVISLPLRQPSHSIAVPGSTPRSSLTACRKLGRMVKEKPTQNLLSFYQRKKDVVNDSDDDVECIAVSRQTSNLNGGKNKQACRSVGLSKKRKSNENLHGDKQTSIKNFFTKFKSERSNDKDNASSRKPLSPTKTNALNDLTPDAGEMSIMTLHDRIGVSRKIL